MRAKLALLMFLSLLLLSPAYAKKQKIEKKAAPLMIITGKITNKDESFFPFVFYYERDYHSSTFPYETAEIENRWRFLSAVPLTGYKEGESVTLSCDTTIKSIDFQAILNKYSTPHGYSLKRGSLNIDGIIQSINRGKKKFLIEQ